MTLSIVLLATVTKCIPYNPSPVVEERHQEVSTQQEVSIQQNDIIFKGEVSLKQKTNPVSKKEHSK